MFNSQGVHEAPFSGPKGPTLIISFQAVTLYMTRLISILLIAPQTKDIPSSPVFCVAVIPSQVLEVFGWICNDHGPLEMFSKAAVPVRHQVRIVMESQ